MKSHEILIIGAGGIGGITAAHMKNAGTDLAVVDHMPGMADKIETEGIHVFGHCPALHVKMKAYRSISEVKGKKDIIFVATKATSLCEVTDQIGPLLKEDTAVVSLQNGVCEEYLVEKIGKHRVIGSVVGWGATMHEPCELEKTSEGNFLLGTLNGAEVNHFDEVKQLLETTAPVEVTGNIIGSLYSKLIINSSITTLGVICGLKLGKMLSFRKIRKIFIEIAREAVAVGKAAGITIEKYANKVDFYTIAERRSKLSNLLNHLIILVIGLKYRRLKSSSLQSLETGRRTEIDYLNGYIVQKGKENQVPTPINNLLVRLVKEIEAGKRQISLKNFDLNEFRQFA